MNGPESPGLAPTDWLRRDIAPLTSDPDNPLDELEPLRDAIGGARVVAIGESSHFITEFQ